MKILLQENLAAEAEKLWRQNAAKMNNELNNEMKVYKKHFFISAAYSRKGIIIEKGIENCARTIKGEGLVIKGGGKLEKLCN